MSADAEERAAERERRAHFMVAVVMLVPTAPLIGVILGMMGLMISQMVSSRSKGEAAPVTSTLGPGQ